MRSSRSDLVHSAWLILKARWFLRQCTRVGPYVRLAGKPPVVRNEGTIVVGARVSIESRVVPIELVAVNGGTIEIGDNCFLNYGVSIQAHELVRIGHDCLLGTYVCILDNNWHDIIAKRRVPPSRPVTLEDNVWLGNRVIVLPGVTIGHDSVVGAGSVVTRDIPARSVAVGNPARVVKTF